jgi:hypothetical protein
VSSSTQRDDRCGPVATCTNATPSSGSEAGAQDALTSDPSAFPTQTRDHLQRRAELVEAALTGELEKLRHIVRELTDCQVSYEDSAGRDWCWFCGEKLYHDQVYLVSAHRPNCLWRLAKELQMSQW